MTYKELKLKLLQFSPDLLSEQSATLYDIDATESYGIYSCGLEGDTVIDGIIPCMSMEGMEEELDTVPMVYEDLIIWLSMPKNEDQRALCIIEETLYEIVDVIIGDDTDEEQLVMVGKEIKG
jgi:hypothetical protein